MTKSTITKRIKGRKRIVTLITSAVLVAAGSGAAFAYWTSQGAGSATSTAGTSVPFTIAQTTSTGGPLTPGGPSQTVSFTVTNPGTGNQYLTGVSAVVAIATGSTSTAWSIGSGSATCSAADYTVSAPAITAGTIAPGASITANVTIAMKNLSTSQDACKGVQVPLYLAAS